MSVLIDQNRTSIIQGITEREAVNMTHGCLPPMSLRAVALSIAKGRRSNPSTSSEIASARGLAMTS